MVAGKDVKPLIVIVGETASGKSTLAMSLATHFGGEIICADSWTVRKGVDIGTAKPSKEDCKLIPHHLIDVVEPCGDFTAAVFKRLANAAITDIINRVKLPIMVGGTGLYIDGVIYDYNFLPRGDRKEREELNSLSIESLLGRVNEAGLEIGNTDTRNKRRLIRLIETQGAAQTKKPLRSNTLLLGLSADREQLKERIVKRVDYMLAAGLEKEVQDLSQLYGWGCESLKGVGYSEWKDYFIGSQSLDETRRRIVKDTNDLAKRQRTWFKRNKSIHWVAKQSEAVDLITTHLNK